MSKSSTKFFGIVVAAVALTMMIGDQATYAYVEIPYALGRIIAESTNIVVMRVEKVDKERNLIIYKKVSDLKGTHPGDVIKHNIGRGGFNPREWQFIMQAAEPGKLALFFHNGSAGETCIDNYWYQAYPGGEWWSMSHGEPYLLRSFAGKPEKLLAVLPSLLAGKEAVVPCMVDGDKNALQLRTAKIQRMKVSLAKQDYDPRRDFAGWGGDEYRQLAGMLGFQQFGAIGRVDPGATGIASADIDGDGKPDLCIYGEEKVTVLRNAGNSMEEVTLPYAGGARSAVFGDFNGDGKPDLLLATPAGPKLFMNMGGSFKDVSSALPREPYYNLTAATFIDFDGDGKQDILLANGFLGLRLYRNQAGATTGAAPKLGKWYYVGPFDNSEGKGFDTAYPPESEFNLAQQYTGKGGEKIGWKEGAFTDGQISNLALFKPEHNVNAVAYVCRELDCATASELPISLGSDDTLTVWLNGEKLLAENLHRKCQPDQNQLTLKLKAGKNKLLMKICQTDGGWKYYFAAKMPSVGVPLMFEDVSDKVGLGLAGVGSKVKGDRLIVADVNGDGRPDFLYCAGNGVLAINTPAGFVESTDSGIRFQPGGITPVFGDFNGDKSPDLFVPQASGCKLFKNDGKGHFADVTAQSGDLAKPIGEATCGIFCDFNNQGRMDLVVGCVRGSNRYFKNNGAGVFTDAGEQFGFYQKVFNSRAMVAVDFNKDGVLDIAMTNEGQESAVLIGSPTRVSLK